MKKVFLFLASAALLLAGCAKEELAPIGGEGEVDVTVEAGMPHVATKAVNDYDGNAYKFNRWIFEVRDSQGKLFYREVKGKEADEPLKQTFKVSLIKNQTYDFLFWADNDNGYYNADDLTKITIEAANDTYVANDDARDAFFAHKNYKSTKSEKITAELFRPFAQVNVITTDLPTLWAQAGTTGDQAAEYAKFAPQNLAFVATIPTSFNVLTEKAGDMAPIAMTATESYTGYQSDKKSAKFQNNYLLHEAKATLFMDYIFASADEKDLLDIVYTFVSNGEGIQHEFNSVPLQRNYRTNIIGHIISNESEWSVEIKPAWLIPDNDVELIDVSTIEEANAALQSLAPATGETKDAVGVNITSELLTGTTEDGRPLEVPAAFSTYTTDQPTTQEPSATNVGATYFNIQGGVDNNVKIIVRDEYSNESSEAERHQLTVYKGNVYISAPDLTATDFDIQLSGSTVYLNGTKVKDATVQTAQNTFIVDAASEITGTLTVKKGNIAIYGKVNSIERSTDNTDAITYVYIYGGGEWTNVETDKSATLVPVYPIASINGTPYFHLLEALAAIQDGETLKLESDATLSGILIVNNGKTFTFDLGGNTITGRVNVSGAKVTFANGTIFGDGTQALNAYGTSDPAYAESVYTYICVNEDVTLKGKYGICFLSTLNETYFPYSYGVKVDFYGKSLCVSPAYVSGNIGNDQQDFGNVDAYAPAGIASRSKAMFNYGPEFNVFGELTCTGSAEENPQGITLSGMIRVNVYPGAKITGGEAIGMKSGNLCVYGGTLKSTGPKSDPVQAVLSGCEASGAAISITSFYTNDFYADRANMSVTIEDGEITGVNNSALLVTHSYDGGQPVALKQGVDLDIAGGKFTSGKDVPVIFIDNAASGDAFPMPSHFITGGNYNKTLMDNKYLAKGYGLEIQSDKTYNAVFSEYAGISSIIEDAQTGETISVYGQSFTKNEDGFCYADNDNKKGRLVYLTFVNPGTSSSNASLKVSTDPTQASITFQNLFLGSEKRLEAPGSYLKGGDIVVLPAMTIYMDFTSTIYDVYGDITWLGAGPDKTIIRPYQKNATSYRYLRLYNRYAQNVTNTDVYHFNFKNLTFDGITQNAGANLFVVTCYNIEINMDNCVVKNFKGSVFSIWANDTMTGGGYPTKADNVGVEVNITNSKLTGNGRLVHYDCSPYQVRDLDAGFDRYAFIHVNYDENTLLDNTEMYDFNLNTAKGQGNCLLNGVDVWTK